MTDMREIYEGASPRSPGRWVLTAVVAVAYLAAFAWVVVDRQAALLAGAGEAWLIVVLMAPAAVLLAVLAIRVFSS